MTTTVSGMDMLKLGLLGLIALMGATFVAPTTVSAATLPYKPQTQLELISYMQGIVDTLQAQIAAGRAGVTSGTGSSRVETFTPVIAVTTRVELRASFDAGNSTSVYAWFEYGEAGALNQKTNRTRLARVSGKVEHSATISNLKSGVQYSYRPVFELSGGSKYYGTVRTFTSANSSGVIVPGNTNTSTTVTAGGNSLALAKTNYRLYEYVSVSFTVPSSRAKSSVWIGMYEVGSSNSKHITSSYTGKRTEGDVSFMLTKSGTFEFRLFYDRSSSPVATSRPITVE